MTDWARVVETYDRAIQNIRQKGYSQTIFTYVYRQQCCAVGALYLSSACSKPYTRGISYGDVLDCLSKEVPELVETFFFEPVMIKREFDPIVQGPMSISIGRIHLKLISALIVLNDQHRLTFEEIGEWLRHQAENNLQPVDPFKSSSGPTVSVFR